MPRSEPAEALPSLYGGVAQGGALLVIADALVDVPGFARVTLMTDATEGERYDAAWIAAPGDDLDALFARTAAQVREGGVIAAPVPRPRGLRRLLRKPPRVALEDLCEALLRAGARDLRVHDDVVSGRVGLAR